ncbi:MAG: hypothetical protein QM811_17375 [Pirellulales bacterium]
MKASFAFSFSLTFLAFVASSHADPKSNTQTDVKERSPITVENFRDREEVRYPVVLINGALDDAAREISAINTSSTRNSAKQKGLVASGRFKILVELVSGENRIQLSDGVSDREIVLTYRPQTNARYVHVVYLTARSGETMYQSPLENDAQDFAGKLDTLLKMLQSFTADSMYNNGHGRKTFNLELDDQGKVKIHVVRCKHDAAHYYALNDQDWYREIERELGEKMADPNAKDFVVAAYSRYEPKLKKTLGHTALGGGHQALFGSGNMFTWPTTLSDVQPAFLDERRIDAERFQDDSAGRNTYWGAASTTMGACLHELGHAFDLPHTRRPLDIMTRGFDHLNRAFTFVDPPSGVNHGAVTVTIKNTGRFEPISADSFAAHDWFTLDARPTADHGPDLRVRIESDDTIIIVESQTDLNFVGIQIGGDAVHHVVPTAENARRIEIPTAKIPDWKPDARATVRIVDKLGNVAVKQIERPRRAK